MDEGRSRGGQTRKEQLGTEGYQRMGRMGGPSTTDQSGGVRAEQEGIDIDESKFQMEMEMDDCRVRSHFYDVYVHFHVGGAQSHVMFTFDAMDLSKVV